MNYLCLGGFLKPGHLNWDNFAEADWLNSRRERESYSNRQTVKNFNKLQTVSPIEHAST